MTSNTLLRVLVPPRPRSFAGQRWLNIILRALHLVGLAGLGGHFLAGGEIPTAYWWLTLASGALLSVLYIWSSALWLVQLKGVVILFKLVLLGLALRYPAWRGELFIAVILISAVIAHAPGAVRGYLLIGNNDGRSGC